MIMRTITAKYLSLLLLLGPVVSEDVTELAQSDLVTEAPGSNLLSVEEDTKLVGLEDLENIVDIKLSEIYWTPGNIKNENDWLQLERELMEDIIEIFSVFEQN